MEFMKKALILAKKAEKLDEVPVGAVIVKNGKVIASGYNKKEGKQNAILHAEIIAIDKACKKLKSFRLNDCDIYVSLEPCPMCAGAIIGARLKNVYFGAYDKKAGCFGSVYNFADGKFNHAPEVFGGIMENESVELLQRFFRNKR